MKLWMDFPLQVNLLVPSSKVPREFCTSFRMQKLLSGCLQILQVPHWGEKRGMTLSPGFTE
ncbi:hypothetical protein NL493_27290, partial [Klebsiella pneumoniae]|nr:hypothetical protein [Klebsiella pneumoniae]